MDVSPVFRALAAGDADALERVLSEDPAAASERDKRGVSTLLFALYARQDGLVPRLREAGAPVGIFEAAALGDDEVVARLLAGEPELARSFASDGFTPLHLAAFFGRLSTAKLLVEAGADVDVAARNPMEVRPINSAAAVGATELVTYLLDRGANPDVAQKGGYTALHSAAHRADLALVRLLVARGAATAVRADDGRLPGDMIPDEAGEQRAELAALLGRPAGT